MHMKAGQQQAVAHKKRTHKLGGSAGTHGRGRASVQAADGPSTKSLAGGPTRRCLAGYFARSSAAHRSLKMCLPQAGSATRAQAALAAQGAARHWAPLRAGECAVRMCNGNVLWVPQARKPWAEAAHASSARHRFTAQGGPAGPGRPPERWAWRPGEQSASGCYATDVTGGRHGW